MIVIVDYGVGNLRSVKNMLKKADAVAHISSKISDIRSAERIILPGVGRFDYGMEKLRQSGLLEELNYAAIETGKPILGICLGAQILGKGSEEGDSEGLGWIDMECLRFPELEGYRVPHMMWNDVKIERPCPLFAGQENGARYYFVHSYHMQCADQDNVVATTNYCKPFTSVVQKDNIVGMQFHPEKSLRFGLQVMRDFCRWKPQADAG